MPDVRMHTNTEIHTDRKGNLIMTKLVTEASQNGCDIQTETGAVL